MHSVIIIEDDIHNAKLMQRMVELLGYEAHVNHSYNEVVQCIQHVEPSLFLLDLRLPGVDGWQIATLLRRDPQYEHIPIIAISVQIHPHDEERALQVGCNAYITKPFDRQKLQQLIQQYIP